MPLHSTWSVSATLISKATSTLLIVNEKRDCFSGPLKTSESLIIGGQQASFPSHPPRRTVLAFMISFYGHDSDPPTWACPGRTFTFIAVVLLRPSNKTVSAAFWSSPSVGRMWPTCQRGRWARSTSSPQRHPPSPLPRWRWPPLPHHLIPIPSPAAPP